MSRKHSAGKRISESNAKGKNINVTAAKIVSFRHKTIALFKTAFLLFTCMYFMSGTLAMGIIYHQHKGHLFSWLAGDESIAQKQAAIEQRKAAEQAELEAECQVSYDMSCAQYTLTIGEATRTNKLDQKQVTMLEKAKNRAKLAM